MMKIRIEVYWDPLCLDGKGGVGCYKARLGNHHSCFAMGGSELEAMQNLLVKCANLESGYVGKMEDKRKIIEAGKVPRSKEWIARLKENHAYWEVGKNEGEAVQKLILRLAVNHYSIQSLPTDKPMGKKVIEIYWNNFGGYAVARLKENHNVSAIGDDGREAINDLLAIMKADAKDYDIEVL